jgi:tRNA threonylcarbamoyladenosine biosynthesis protein TsaE
MTHVTIVASPDGHTARQPRLEPIAARDFIWTDEAACAAMAGSLAAVLKPALAAGGSIYIELHGTLGAGKTTFTRHLLRALGVQGRIKSPSYAVVEPHEVPGMAIHHFDFYRFNDPQEWEDAGFRDLFAAPGLKLAEWPEKADGLLPTADLQVHIQPMAGCQGGDSERRTVRIEAASDTGLMALQALPASAPAVKESLGQACTQAVPPAATQTTVVDPAPTAGARASHG